MRYGQKEVLSSSITVNAYLLRIDWILLMQLQKDTTQLEKEELMSIKSNPLRAYVELMSSSAAI